MIGDVCGRVGTLALVCVASCTTAVAHVPAQGGRLDSGVIAGGGGAGGAIAAAGPATPTEKAAVLARLSRLNRSGRFLFGQENATLWGMYLNGGLVSTNTWFETTARAGRFTSDSEAVVGDAPAVLGVSLGMLAFEPPSWNRRRATAEAIRRHFAQGGLVTMDWHAPSCDASVGAHSAGALGTVTVNGHDVVVHAITGGTLFYAEEEYTRAVVSRSEVPESLKCLCRIANDQPLVAGPYKGTTGRTWLVAHAKYAAQVMREEGLSGLPIILRPFHEHTGSWFWWGQPYWNCAALLDKPDAVSGAEAYKTLARTFVSALRAEPGMDNLVFAYSPDKLLGPGEGGEPSTAAENKVMDPMGRARDILRARLVRELTTAGLAFDSPAQRAASLPASRATDPSRQAAYVTQRRPYYVEAYAGDDVFDVLGIDLYHPIARAANRADLHLFRLQLDVLAEEARARAKPYALTEAGTYRLQLEALAAKVAPGRPLPINDKKSVDDALARLFDASDRAALLRHFGLAVAGPILLGPAERAAVVPKASEDWFNRQLLVLAHEARVAYALVWQTYYDSSSADRYFNYYIPYPGHPDANSFKRFYAHHATCFLRDSCGR